MCSKSIRVKGKGNVKVHPDITRITIELTGVREEYGDTLELASKYTKAFHKLMEPLGFTHKDLKTLNFSINTETENYKEDGEYKSRFIGYRFTHRLKVEFDSDNERLGKILFALAHSPLDPKFNISFTVKDPEAIRKTLLAKAVKDAREKALILTEAAGLTLGEILDIDYSWDEIDFEVKPFDEGGRIYGASPEPESYDMDFETDDIKASDTVELVWEIK